MTNTQQHSQIRQECTNERSGRAILFIRTGHMRRRFPQGCCCQRARMEAHASIPLKERLMYSGPWYSHWFGAARPLSSRCGCLCSTAGAAMQVMCASAACLCASVHTRRLPSILAEKLGQVASTAAGSSRNSFREVKVFVGVWLQTRDRNFWFPPRWREHSLNREASASSLQWGTNRTAHTAHVYVCGYLLAARCSPLQAIPHSYLRPCCGSGCVLFLGAE